MVSWLKLSVLEKIKPRLTQIFKLKSGKVSNLGQSLVYLRRNGNKVEVITAWFVDNMQVTASFSNMKMVNQRPNDS